MIPDISEYAWLANLGLYWITKYWGSSGPVYVQERRTDVAVISDMTTFVGELGRAENKTETSN